MLPRLGLSVASTLCFEAGHQGRQILVDAGVAPAVEILGQLSQQLAEILFGEHGVFAGPLLDARMVPRDE